MPINFNSQINSLFAANVASDAAYQSPGTYGIPTADIVGTLSSVTMTAAGTGYTSIQTFGVTTGTGATF